MNQKRVPKDIRGRLNLIFSMCFTDYEACRALVRYIKPKDLPVYYQILYEAFANEFAKGTGKIDMPELALYIAKNYDIQNPYEMFSEVFLGTPNIQELVTANDIPLIAQEVRRDRVYKEVAALIRDKKIDEAKEVLKELEEPLVDDKGLIDNAQVEKFAKEVEEAKNKGGINGYKTGIPTLDDITSGIIPGQIWALGGPTSSGKTTLATQMLLNALLGGAVCAAFSLEMSRFRTIARLVGAYQGISPARIARGTLSEDELIGVTGSLQVISSFRLRVYRDIVELRDIVQKCREIKAIEGRLDVVLIDFIQNIAVKGFPHTMDRLCESVRLFQQVSGELNTAFIIVSQLSNEMVREKGKGIFSYRYVPELAHAADVGLELVDQRERQPIGATLIVKKNRDGRLAKIDLAFSREYSSFTEVNEWQEQREARA